jgi:hypothetical protein
VFRADGWHSGSRDRDGQARQLPVSPLCVRSRAGIDRVQPTSQDQTYGAHRWCEGGFTTVIRALPAQAVKPRLLAVYFRMCRFPDHRRLADFPLLMGSWLQAFRFLLEYNSARCSDEGLKTIEPSAIATDWRCRGRRAASKTRARLGWGEYPGVNWEFRSAPISMASSGMTK